MRPTRLASPAEFLALDLRCHTLLHDVPLHDVWRVELRGGGPGRTLRDVQALRSERTALSRSPLVSALFATRFAVGRALGWDKPRGEVSAESYLRRLDDDDRARSRIVPGTMRGAFRILYAFDDEELAEIRNATVHGFLASVLRPRATGYTLFWAIYVKPVSRLTPLYMAAIDPFRRWIVYPSILGELGADWTRAYGGE